MSWGQIIIRKQIKLKIILGILVLFFAFSDFSQLSAYQLIFSKGGDIAGDFKIALYNYSYGSYEFATAIWNPPAVDPGECSDSVDNDGDGQTDFSDFGCFGPNFQETNANYGWTLFEPEGTTRIVYVSNSEGNDNNDGLSSATPVKTLAQGITLLRDDQGDWLLLKRGDTWTNETFGSWAKDGKSAAHPLLISSYGTATTRPLVKVGSSSPLSSNNSGYIAIKGLYLYAHTRDYDGGEFNSTAGGNLKFLAQGNLTYILLEDNRIDGIYTSIENNVAGATTYDVRLRRNIFHDSYSTSCNASGTCEHSQGIFLTGIDGILVEENVFDHNGWNDNFLLAITPQTTTIADWQAVTDGVFRIRLEGSDFQVTGLDFSGITNLTNAATILTTGVNAALAAASDARRVTISLLGSQFLVTSNDFFNEGEGGTNYQVNVSTAAGTQIAGLLLTIGGLNPSATQFNHSMYITANNKGGNNIVRGNIVSRSSSHGTQLRPGGLIDDNLYVNNSIHFFVGSRPSIARNNVILGGKDISPDYPRGWGINPQNQADTVFENNILAHNTSNESSGYYAISLSNVGTGITRITVQDNIIYNWKSRSGSSIGLIDFPDLLGLSDDITVEDNIVYDLQGGSSLVSVRQAVLDSGKVTFTNNRYYSTDANPNDNFAMPGTTSKDFDTWKALSGETGTYGAISFPDAGRNINTYMVSIGASPTTLDNFIAEAKLQSRFNWRTQYTAEAVNDYIRAGFGVSDCAESWSCGVWNACQPAGTQTRTCTDANACGTTADKPAISQSCVYTCAESWSCGAWSSCSNNQQTRTCTDANSCGTIVNQPAISQSCTTTQTCTENWSCTNWSSCSTANTQARTCTDASNCGTTVNKPNLSQSCTYVASDGSGGGAAPPVTTTPESEPTETTTSQPLDRRDHFRGRLIKTANSSAVYHIGADGKRRLFVNAPTYWTWRTGTWATQNIEIVSQQEFDGVDVADNITVRPGTNLIRFQNSPRVYAVMPNARLCLATFGYGDNWQERIVTIQNAFENNYTKDPNCEVKAGSRYPDGTLFKYEGSNNVWYLENGQKRQVVDSVLRGLQFNLQFLITNVSQSIEYPNGAPLERW